ncbi:hypothetical protein C8F01DRAFT_1087151 [Mycena amicta]|nr:hypothetical protein C8F01DRAFT_1087151 [Mycena amicta]
MPPSTTITVPDGTSNHGDPSLLCTPTHWTSILGFFLGNYIAHAATTLSYPGEEFGDYVQTIVIALLFPTAGVVRGLDAIFRCAILGTSDLMCAARAGALCMLIRIDDDDEEKPRSSDDSDTKSNADSEYPPWMRENQSLYWRFLEAPCSMRKIHGVQKASLPRGYDFALVPRDAVVLSSQLPPPSSTGDNPIVISTSRNASRAVVAIVQTCYGAYTLYLTRGDQIARYGYAAFGLTVAPYTLMSIINLLGSLLTPSYPTMYLVRSEVMDEIDRRFGRDGRPYFDGTVGVLEQVKHEDEPEVKVDVDVEENKIGLEQEEGGRDLERVLACEEFRRLDPSDANSAKRRELRARAGAPIPPPQFLMLGAIAIGIPLAIIGGLTKFFPGDSSTHAQRVWLMTWLGFGFLGVITISLREDMAHVREALRRASPIPPVASVILHMFPLSVMLGYSAPAIGGMVVVAQMMKSYGDCVHL